MAEEIRSLRLTFRYDDDGLRLVDRTARRSPAPPTERLDREAPAGAITLELRSRQDAVRYRRYLIDAIPQSIEVGTDDGGNRRVDHVRPAGGFSIVVPIPDDEAALVVSAGPGVSLEQPGLAGIGKSGEWRELLRQKLEEG